MSLTIFEWIKHLVARAFGGGDDATKQITCQVPKDGVSVFLVDKWEHADTLMHKVIHASFTETERDASLVYNDHHASFDPAKLDTWVNSRQLDPYGSAYILFQVVDLSVFESGSFKLLLSKLELLNVSVLIVLPAKKAFVSLLQCADRIILDVPPRKFRNTERGALYRVIFPRKNVTYSHFMYSWTRSHKERHSVLIEHNVIRPWN